MNVNMTCRINNLVSHYCMNVLLDGFGIRSAFTIRGCVDPSNFCLYTWFEHFHILGMEAKAQKYNTLRISYGVFHCSQIIHILKLLIKSFYLIGNLQNSTAGNSAELETGRALPGKFSEMAIRVNNVDIH